ncbi:MAG TPA: cupin domain-containing protein [Candidatus Saccharimonadales bacterium]|nr:cupin domain-containing protein [Candidatus Saccharimonadales bacterium]
MDNTAAITSAWTAYLKTISNWQDLVKGVEPKEGGCGLIYELPNPIDRPTESFAIADMRELKVAEPHYHPKGVIEIYFVLQGSGLVVVGGKGQKVAKGSTVVIPPNTAHFTIPSNDLVLAAINTPPFRPEDYIVVTETNPDVKFDKEQFERLSNG